MKLKLICICGTQEIRDVPNDQDVIMCKNCFRLMDRDKLQSIVDISGKEEIEEMEAKAEFQCTCGYSYIERIYHPVTYVKCPNCGSPIEINSAEKIEKSKEKNKKREKKEEERKREERKREIERWERSKKEWKRTWEGKKLVEEEELKQIDEEILSLVIREEMEEMKEKKFAMDDLQEKIQINYVEGLGKLNSEENNMLLDDFMDEFDNNQYLDEYSDEYLSEDEDEGETK